MIWEVWCIRAFIDDFTVPPKNGVLAELALAFQSLSNGLS